MHVASLKFQGGESKKSLEILYNVMQWPVGHDQRAYSTGMLRGVHTIIIMKQNSSCKK